MWNWLGRAFIQVVPRPVRWSEGAARPRPTEGLARLKAFEAAVAGIPTVEVARELVLHIRGKYSDEGARQNSVMSRAQSLFFAVALIASLMTLSASLAIGTYAAPKFALLAVAIVSAGVIVQVVMMVLNIIRAVKGRGYPHTGLTEMTSWAAAQEPLHYYRFEALNLLELYRQTTFLNDWRFSSLDRALMALRNIVFLSCALVIVLFALAYTRSDPDDQSLQATKSQGPSLARPCGNGVLCSNKSVHPGQPHKPTANAGAGTPPNSGRGP